MRTEKEAQHERDTIERARQMHEAVWDALGKAEQAMEDLSALFDDEIMRLVSAADAFALLEDKHLATLEYLLFSALDFAPWGAPALGDTLEDRVWSAVKRCNES